ncbi:MAG: zinc ribbon domain-containing protein [Lachnospiraceae bacterium]|nr:zinc ribbon domain-containing protein [Lachnospiraceae bacterium]
MFCSQCGAQIADNSLFCPNCGNQVIRSQSNPQVQVANPNPQPQYQQPPMQGQIPPQYQQPQMQGQPPYGQPGPQMQGQPPYGQPGQQMQGQPQYQQPRPPMQGQIPPQPPRPMAPPPQQKPPKKKKKGIVGIIILIIVLILLLFALLAGVIAIVVFSGVLKNPKKVFAENVVTVTENINGEIPSIGSIPLEALFHLGVDDTQNSHTSVRTTEIVSEQMSEYNVELVQSYSYNKDNGDTAYDFSVNVNGSPMGNGSIYFADDEFLYVPMNTNDPMVRYVVDSATKENLKDLGAMERFSLMVMEKNRGSDINWKQETKDFSKNVLADIPKSSFKKSKGTYMILGAEQKCQTVTVNVSDSEAYDLIRGLSELIYKGIETGDEENLTAFESIVSEYEDYGGTLDLTMTTYRYKKTPVAITMEVSLNGAVSTYDISYYKKGSEKQFIVDGGDSYYEESVVSKGLGQTHMTNKMDFGSAYLTIEQDSTGIGNSKELKGTFEIVPNLKSDEGGAASIAGKTISGTIEETSILGNGLKTTTISNENGSVSIITTLERTPLDTGKITPPTFISASGIDCGTDLEDLKSTLKVFTKEDAPKIDNSIAHMAQVYYLIFKNANFNELGEDYD